MLGVCAYVFENSQELFQEAMEVQVKKTARGLHVGISWPDLDTLAAGEENLMNAKFILPYMNTVYDEYGEETEFVQYPLSEEYLRTIGDPLPGTPVSYTHLKRMSIEKQKNNVLRFEQKARFHYLKYQKLADRGNYIDALVALRAAAAKDPENTDYQMELAELYTERCV